MPTSLKLIKSLRVFKFSCLLLSLALPMVVHADEADVEVQSGVPNQELTAQLLSDLLSLNLALYEDEWQLGLERAKSAALQSQDARLAKAAAVLAVQNRDYLSGLEMAEFWLKLDPTAEDGADVYLLCLVNQGMVELALDYLDQAEELTAQAIDITVRELAGLVVQQNQSEPALALMLELINRHPESAQVQLSAAYVAGAFGQQALALERLDRALELKPGWESAALSKAELITGAQQADKRMQFLRDFLEEYPRSNELRTVFAAEVAKAGDLETAMSEIKRVLRVQKDSVKALTYAALITTQMGNYAEAQRYYRRVLEVEPSNQEALMTLARFSERDGRLVLAKDYYRQIESGDNYVYAQVRLAAIVAGQGDVDKALDDLSFLEPESENEFVDIAITRHYLLMQARRYEEALGYVNDSLLRLPNDIELRYARGLVAADLRKLSLAEEDFRAVLKASPDNADALNALGYTLADQSDRYDEAQQLIERAYAIKPNSAHIVDSLGWVFYKIGELDKARQYLEEALSLSAQDEIVIHLAEVLWAMDMRDEAMAHFRSVHAKSPDLPLLIKTLDRLGVVLDKGEADELGLRDET